MTTVYWDPAERMLYADTRSTSDAVSGGHAYTRYRDCARKVVLLPESKACALERSPLIALAGAGDVRTIEFLIALLIRHGLQLHEYLDQIPNLRLLLKPKCRARVLAFTKERVYRFTFRRGRFYEYSQALDDPKPLAIGSGADHATALRRVFNLPVSTALLYARLADDSTGGPIDRYFLRKDGTFEALEPIPAHPPEDDYGIVRRAIADLPGEIDPKEPNPYFAGNPLYERTFRSCKTKFTSIIRK